MIAVMGVHGGQQALHPGLRHQGGIAPSIAVDIRGHGAFQPDPVFPGHALLHFQRFPQDHLIDQVAAVQVTGGQPDFPLLHVLPEGADVFRRAPFQEAFQHPEGFHVPAEARPLGLSLRLPKNLHDALQVFRVVPGDFLLPVRIAHVRMCVMNQIEFHRHEILSFFMGIKHLF